MLNFAGVLDKDVSDHLENSTVFKGNSATIQNEKFKFSGHLRISQLFLAKYFTVYKSCFPLKLIETVKKCYPVVECKQLERELKTFYSRKEMHQDGLVKILLYLEEHNLTKIFNETTKLLRILITIPMTSVEAERTFSSLKRIKTFLRNTMGQSRLNSLSVISIGRDLLKNRIKLQGRGDGEIYQPKGEKNEVKSKSLSIYVCKVRTLDLFF